MVYIYKGIIRGGKNNMKINPKTGVHYPSRDWVLWRDDAMAQFMSQGIVRFKDAPCTMTVQYWAGDLRRRDVPAMEDALFHVFEKIGVIDDDSQFQTCHWNYRGLDRENPRAVIHLEKTEEIRALGGKK